ncbi:MAG: hypothetical protein N2C13_04115 [Chloroflexota bacterium]
MNKYMNTLLFGLLLLIGCTAPEPIPTSEPTGNTENSTLLEPSANVVPTPTPTFANRAEDIAGEWEGQRGFFIKYFQDGTYGGGTRTPGEIGPDAPIQGNYWFDGIIFFIEDIRNDYYLDEVGELCFEIGSYKIVLMENGNLAFVLIEDDCEKRREVFSGIPKPAD